MTEFNYREYSLSQLENWVHDSMSAGEASPQEIYNTIHKAVEENYYLYKQRASEAYELLALLNGNGKSFFDNLSHNEVLSSFAEDKVCKWILPVEVDGASGEYYLQLPDDLLDQLGWKEGDSLEYIDNNNGTVSVKKVSSPQEE